MKFMNKRLKRFYQLAVNPDYLSQIEFENLFIESFISFSTLPFTSSRNEDFFIKTSTNYYEDEFQIDCLFKPLQRIEED